MKRFYREVTISQDDSGFRVLLDGRAVKTVGGHVQAIPTAALAEAMAAEWSAQGEEIDSAGFLFRDMADYAIDVVAPERARAIMELLPYAETDTLCYRAEPDEALGRRQNAVWEPLLTAAEARLGIRFIRVAGVMHRPQPAGTLDILRDELEKLDAFALAALRNTAGLAASLTLGLMAIEPGADVEALWTAANLEEDWQAEHWGKDAEAMERQELRRRAFAAAARFAGLSRG